ncbi:MAG: hypothetical protein OEW58_00415 [Gammaproteobacteria bacterium]|nr:hypothetical protein [Gammaproteobacteria bacterium]
MYRWLIISIVLMLVMTWLGMRFRKTNVMVSTALFTAAVVFALLLVGAGTGLIGG